MTLCEALGHAEDGGRRRRALKAVQRAPDAAAVAAGAVAGAVRPRARPARARAVRLPRVARGRADDRGARPDREPAGARRRRAGVRRAGRRSRPCRLPPGDLARLRPGHDPRGAEPRHADDAPQREGPRVRRRVHDRDGGGDLPALALDRGAGDRGGAAARVRRHDAGEGAADADARVEPLALGQPRATTCPRASSTSCRRPRSRASGCGPRRGRTTAPRPRRRSSRATTCPRSRPATPCATGRSARASSSRIEPGGVVTVRFADDGVERRLMLEYAPLEKI